MLRGVSDDRNDDDAGEELGHAERLQRRLERAHEDLRLDGRQHRADRQQRHCGAVSHVRRRSFGHPQRVLVGAKGEDEPRGIDREQDQRRPETQTIDHRRVRLERSERDEIDDRRHDERDDREREHHRRGPGRGPVEALRAVFESAGQTGQAEDQEQVSDDAAGDRRFHDLEVMALQRHDRDDQLRGVAERRVEEAAERRAGPARERFGPRADQSCRGYQRDRRRHEHGKRGPAAVEHPAHGRGDEQHVEPRRRQLAAQLPQEGHRIIIGAAADAATGAHKPRMHTDSHR